jgi:hypothetical protein
MAEIKDANYSGLGKINHIGIKISRYTTITSIAHISIKKISISPIFETSWRRGKKNMTWMNAIITKINQGEYTHKFLSYIYG